MLLSREQIQELRDLQHKWVTNITDMDKVSGLTTKDGGCFYCGIHKEKLTETVGDLTETALSALARVEELEKELVAQTIGESIEQIRDARIAVRKKYPHLFTNGNV